MTLSLWAWFFAILGALFSGAFVAFLITWIYDYFLKRRLAKKVKILSDSDLAKPNRKELNEQEVKEDERREYAEFRDFEKLKRIATTRAGDNRTERENPNRRRESPSPTRTSSIPKRAVLQDDVSLDIARDNKEDRRANGIAKERIQRIKIADI